MRPETKLKEDLPALRITLMQQFKDSRNRPEEQKTSADNKSKVYMRTNRKTKKKKKMEEKTTV